MTVNQLLTNGIVVSPSVRGIGIGNPLLKEISTFAESKDYESVRLDVFDANPNPRRLYERNGFKATHTEKFGSLRWLPGLGASTTLVRYTENVG